MPFLNSVPPESLDWSIRTKFCRPLGKEFAQDADLVGAHRDVSVGEAGQRVKHVRKDGEIEAAVDPSGAGEQQWFGVALREGVDVDEVAGFGAVQQGAVAGARSVDSSTRRSSAWRSQPPAPKQPGQSHTHELAGIGHAWNRRAGADQFRCSGKATVARACSIGSRGSDVGTDTTRPRGVACSTNCTRG